MPYEMASRILQEGASMGVSSVKFNWRGEPLLHSYITQLVKEAKDLGFVDTMVNTNGNVSRETIKKLCARGIDTLIFSLDSIEPTIYPAIRRGGKLMWVISNIITAASSKQKIGYPKRVVVQAREQYLNETELRTGKFQKFWSIFDVIVRVGYAMRRTGNFMTSKNRMTIGRKNCYMPNRRILIDWKGDIYPCCCDWKGFRTLGNIEHTSLKEAWDSLKPLRKALKKGTAFTDEPCKNCFSRESYKWEKSVKKS